MTFRGWLLDLYLNQEEGLTLWFIGEDDRRVCFRQAFPASFYAAGPNEQLRALWKQVNGKAGVLGLSRKQKQDVFVADPVDVMQIDMASPASQVRLFRDIEAEFPDLTYYDADVTIGTRYMARHGVFPLALCELEADEDQLIQSIHPLNTRWDLIPNLPPLRIFELKPDCDPNRGKVRSLLMRTDRFAQHVPLDPAGDYLRLINEALATYDPDIFVTDWGDSWLIPFLNAQSEEKAIPLQLNRDATRPVRWQKETTYFSYGHIIYRPEEAHLFGRCHVDRKSSMMWSDYSLAGTLEMARVTTLPIEKAARVSPGQGISAMQVITALEKDILVPYQKRQVEEFKSGMHLIQSDRGGMVYQPKVGLHMDVAQVDFCLDVPGGDHQRQHFAGSAPAGVARACQGRTGRGAADAQTLYQKRVEIKEDPPIPTGSPNGCYSEGTRQCAQVAIGGLFWLFGLQKRALWAHRSARSRH